MRNFPKTEEEFNQTTPEEFMDTFREILSEARKHLEGKVDLDNLRLMLALPPNYVTPIKNLCPKESMVVLHDMFVGFFVDDQLIMVNNNINVDEPTIYVIQAPVDYPGERCAEAGRGVTVRFGTS